jgi:hypothetical protein
VRLASAIAPHRHLLSASNTQQPHLPFPHSAVSNGSSMLPRRSTSLSAPHAPPTPRLGSARALIVITATFAPPIITMVHGPRRRRPHQHEKALAANSGTRWTLRCTENRSMQIGQIDVPGYSTRPCRGEEGGVPPPARPALEDNSDGSVNMAILKPSTPAPFKLFFSA